MTCQCECPDVPTAAVERLSEKQWAERYYRGEKPDPSKWDDDAKGSEMKRLVAVEVTTNKEFEVLKRGMADPLVRALAITIGYLQPLEERQRRRVLNFLCDRYFTIESKP